MEIDRKRSGSNQHPWGILREAGCGRTDTLAYTEPIHGMWPMQRYITLLMGEIPRLTDDADGYGPNGKGFIAHVEIPERVQKAFAMLRTVYKDAVREANPLYASKGENGV